MNNPRPDDWQWSPDDVRLLRGFLHETQAEFAERIGTRQQTVSEWETGSSKPRRIARRLLHLVAEERGFYSAAAAPADDASFLAAETAMVAGAKKVALMCLGLAVQKFGQELTEQQEALGHFADIAMETYALESSVLRARKRAAAQGEDKTALVAAAVRCFAQDAMDRIEVSARRLLAAVDEGDTLRTYLAALRRFTKREIADTIALRRQVAEAAIEAGGYPLG